MTDQRDRRPWEKPFAVTRPVYVALVLLLLLGIGVTLGGAAIRERFDPAFRPHWSSWVLVCVAVAIGVLGLAALALLAQRKPPPVYEPARPFPPPVEPGTARALLRGEPLTPAQEASAQRAVDEASSRRLMGVYLLGPMYLLLGVAGVFTHAELGAPWIVLGAVMSAVGLVAVRRRRQLLRAAAQRGLTPSPRAPR